MCGIVGLVGFDAERPIDRGRIEAMRDVIDYRGPDGFGLYVDRGIGLGHRRLAIVDVSGGHQPMSNEDGSAWVVFNGEIYNHAELRPDLVARGHVYRTRSDTETILHLYDEYGVAGLSRLEGMFAIAIWDAARRRLILARDRLGIKPLYYAVTDRELMFGSEIKTLIAGGLRPRFRSDVLPEFLASRYVAGTDTFFDVVKRLAPGRVLTWSANEGIAIRRYWHLPAAGENGASMASAAATLREELSASVKRHLMSDVPLGVFLSGGLDSSALAALTAGLIGEPVRTFSVGFEEAEGNELPYARSVARAIRAEHHEVTVTADDFFDALPDLVWRQDEPMAFSSGVPLYFVSRLAEQHVKVVLTGEGADELFLGYNRYRVTAWNERLGRAYRACTSRRLRSTLRSAIARLPWALRRYPERTFLGLDTGYRNLFFENFAVFPEQLQGRLLSSDESERGDPYAFAIERYQETVGGSLDRMGATDLQTYLCELLMKQDRMSMAASIESRVPFLDDRLVDHVARLPARLKLHGWRTKAVLRRAVRDLLPREILTRRKMGFPVPIGRWLRDTHWPVVEEFVLSSRTRDRRYFRDDGLRQLAEAHRRGEAEHGDRLWLLINLEIWQRIFTDGDRPADVMRLVRRRRPRLVSSRTVRAAVH